MKKGIIIFVLTAFIAINCMSSVAFGVTDIGSLELSKLMEASNANASHLQCCLLL